MENKLPEPFKSEWVAALRSGKYVQTRSVLYNGDDREGRHLCCCLGVAEHICGSDLNDLRDCTIPYYVGLRGENIKHKGKAPSLLQEEWDDSFNNVVSKLAAMNDGLIKTDNGDLDNTSSKSFEEIAEFIEKEL